MGEEVDCCVVGLGGCTTVGRLLVGWKHLEVM